MQGVQGPRAARAVRACLAGGVRRRVGGMCSCVWAWRGGSRGEKRVPRACAGCGPRYRLAPSPAASVGGGPLCVYLCATQPGAGCGVWVQLVRRLRGKEGRARCGATQPVVDRRLRSAACACVRSPGCGGVARLTEPQVFAGGGGARYQRTKRKPTGGCARSQQGGGVRLGAAPRSRREGAPAQAPRASGRKKNARKAAAHGSTGAEGAFRASEGSGEGGLVRGDVNHGTKRGGKKRTAHLAHFAHFF